MGIYSSRSTNKGSEYRDYIGKHIDNVSRAFELYKDDIFNVFEDCEELQSNISKHDNSKYSEEEFESYRQFFYPENGESPDKNKMNYGWLHHIHNNPHHWNYWLIIENGNIITLDMPNVYIAEMILDWIAMGMHFNNSAKDWYMGNYDNIIISEINRKLIDSFMCKFIIKY